MAFHTVNKDGQFCCSSSVHVNFALIVSWTLLKGRCKAWLSLSTYQNMCLQYRWSESSFPEIIPMNCLLCSFVELLQSCWCHLKKMLTAALKHSVLLTRVCPALGKFKVMARAVLNLEILSWQSMFCEMKKNPKTLVSKDGSLHFINILNKVAKFYIIRLYSTWCQGYPLAPYFSPFLLQISNRSSGK